MKDISRQKVLFMIYNGFISCKNENTNLFAITIFKFRQEG